MAIREDGAIRKSGTNTPQGQELVLRGPQGQESVRLMSTDKGGVIVLYNENGAPVVTIHAVETGGRITVVNNAKERSPRMGAVDERCPIVDSFVVKRAGSRFR